MNSKAPAPYAVLVTLGLAWGLSIPLSKVAMSTGHQPIGLIFWQFVVAVLVLGAIAAVRGTKPAFDARALRFYVVIGLLGTLIPNNFSYLAISHLPAGIIAIIIASVPMFSLLIALVLRVELFSVRRTFGVALGAVAVGLLFGPDTSLPDPQKAIFVLVALVAPFCYGAEGNYIALRAPKNVDPLTTLLGASVFGACIAAPISIFSGSWVDLSVAWSTAEWALLASALLHVVAYTGYVWLVQATGPVFASQVSYVVTLAGVLFGVALLGERHSLWVLAGLFLMLIGLNLVSPKSTKR